MFDNLTNKQDAPASASPATDSTTTPAASTDTLPSGQAPATTAPVVGEPNSQSQTPNTPSPDGAQPGTAPQVAEPDYNAIFDKMSGGAIKDVDSFKAALTQIKEYPTLKQERDDFAAKMAQAPVFADDEVRILNELKRSGATKEQIKNFQKINEYGDLSEMAHKDALIAAMVMTGTKPSTAELKVNRDFKLDDESIDPSERELLDDDLRVAGINARVELEKLKAKASDVAQVAPEEAQLQLQAKTLAHQAAVKPYVTEVMSSISHLGVFTLSPAKDGAEAVSYTLPIDDSVKAELGQFVQNYFMDGLVPVTPETTIEAMSYARAEYFRTNAEKVFQQIYNEAVSKTTEALVNKYENRSGLKPQTDAPPVAGTNDAAATAQFMQKVANRTT